MKDKIVRFSRWAQKNWLALVIFLSVLMMLFLCAVMFSWLYGYWSNALKGTHFELASCWQGITVVCTGIAGVVALGKACWTKYGMTERAALPIAVTENLSLTPSIGYMLLPDSDLEDAAEAAYGEKDSVYGGATLSLAF